MSNKELTNEELEAELDKAFETNDGKKDNCGSPIPANKEVGLQRTAVKLKKEEEADEALANSLFEASGGTRKEVK